LHQFGYNFFNLSKLTLHEIKHLDENYKEEHKSEKERKEDEVRNLIAKTIADNIENGSNRHS
jgi:hypothetical protein